MIHSEMMTLHLSIKTKSPENPIGPVQKGNLKSKIEISYIALQNLKNRPSKQEDKKLGIKDYLIFNQLYTKNKLPKQIAN